MKNLKKLLCGALSLTMILALAACGSSSGGDHDDTGASGGDVPIIGISQYGQHGSLDNCREGFLLGLEKAGKRGRTTRLTTRTPALTTTWPFRLPRLSPRRMRP